MKPRLGSLFSGIGGIDLAFQRAGFDIAFQVETDDFCNRILAKHWPNVPRFGDIRTAKGSDLPAIDVLAGGFPCQPASLAGRRRGKEDERWLWPEFARLIGEIRPRIAFMENVPGILSLGGIHVAEDLAALGYDCEWGIMAAADAGAPHKRERWFCVAYASRTCNAVKSSSDVSETLVYAVPGTDGRTEPRNFAERVQVSRRTETVVGNSESKRTSTVQQSGQPCSAEQTGVGVGQADAKEPGLESVIDETPCPGSASHSIGVPDPDGEPMGRSSVSWGKRSNGSTQSVLGRATYGLSRQLDGARWPARPGEPQHEWEAPRTGKGIPDRAKRLKALGNAVVPQVVYPIAVAIRETLEDNLR